LRHGKTANRLNKQNLAGEERTLLAAQRRSKEADQKKKYKMS